MTIIEIDSIIESLLFSTAEPLCQKDLSRVFSNKIPVLDNSVERLNFFYEKNKRAFHVLKIAGGYQLVTREEFEPWIRQLSTNINKLSLSKPALDALSIIAYKQPVSRLEIESIRGVDSSAVIKNLLNKKIISISGRDSTPGRPLLYKTTKEFLLAFGINHLSDLPKIKEVSELIDSDSDFGEQIAVFDEENSEENNNKYIG